jgi:carbon-monoxide dehydrogenase medium subunit
LKTEEFLVEAIIPKQPQRCGSAFLKFGRTAYDFNLVNVAVSISVGNGETCSDARIYLGGVGRTPLRASVSEKEIKGKRIDNQAILKAAASLGHFMAIPQIHGNAEYKRDIARVLLRDCVCLAKERAVAI